MNLISIARSAATKSSLACGIKALFPLQDKRQKARPALKLKYLVGAIAIAATTQHAASAQTGYLTAKFNFSKDGTRSVWDSVTGNTMTPIKLTNLWKALEPHYRSVMVVNIKNTAMSRITITNIAFVPTYGPPTMGSKVVTSEDDYWKIGISSLNQNECLNGRPKYFEETCSFAIGLSLMYAGEFDYTMYVTYHPTGTPSYVMRSAQRVMFSISNDPVMTVYGINPLPPFEYVCQSDC